jgi:hypothetical protein
MFDWLEGLSTPERTVLAGVFLVPAGAFARVLLESAIAGEFISLPTAAAAAGLLLYSFVVLVVIIKSPQKHFSRHSTAPQIKTDARKAHHI